MTVTYIRELATANFGVFLKLLFRWRGSIYKLIWKDFVVFAAIYYTLSFVYLFALNEPGKRYFESIALYCEKFNDLIPVAFILGFYVSLVISRFWEQLDALPWPSRLSVFVSTLVQGPDVRSRLIRRTIVRYLSLSYVLTMRLFCKPVERRFPSYDVITTAGLMTEDEQQAIESLESSRSKKPSVYYVPLVWAACLVNVARKEGRIKDDFAVKTLIDEINDFRGKCGSLLNFDKINVPLVYTQVVTIAVYTFFLSCLMGRQYLERASNSHETETYFPLFTFLQFFFYMGWLEVAAMLMNPFGEDDDDFEINNYIDGNLETSYIIVDHMFDKVPELVQDKYWSQLHISIPYHKGSEQYNLSETAGSLMAKSPTKKDQSKFSKLFSRSEKDRLASSATYTSLHKRAESEEESLADMMKSKSNENLPASWTHNLQETEMEEMQFKMSDIDINGDHQSPLIGKKGDALLEDDVISELAPLATPETDDLDSRLRLEFFQKKPKSDVLGARRYEMSSFSQNFVDDIRDQLKSLRQGSPVSTPRL